MPTDADSAPQSAPFITVSRVLILVLLLGIVVAMVFAFRRAQHHDANQYVMLREYRALYQRHEQLLQQFQQEVATQQQISGQIEAEIAVERARVDADQRQVVVLEEHLQRSRSKQQALRGRYHGPLSQLEEELQQLSHILREQGMEKELLGISESQP